MTGEPGSLIQKVVLAVMLILGFVSVGALVTAATLLTQILVFLAQHLRPW